MAGGFTGRAGAGPGSAMKAVDYQSILDKVANINGVEFLVASGSLPPGAPENFYAQVANRVRKNKVKFVLDASGKALSEILKEGAYLIKPSIDELEDLTGQKANNESEQRDLLLRLLNNYDIEIIVLSLGAEGALLATRNEVQHFPAPLVEQKSSIGAGDSMVAGITYSLSKGKSLTKSVLYGLACGSATVMTPGTKLLHKEDAEQLYDELLFALLKQ